MDFGVVVDFVAVMVSGFALGMLLTLARPRDEEAAAMHRHQARRALAWLPDRLRPKHVRLRPAADPGSHG